MFNTQIPLYGIMILSSLIANVIIVMLIYKRFNFSKDEIIGALVYENIGIIFGAKLLTYIQHFKEYDNFNLLQLGFTSYGGVNHSKICYLYLCHLFH